MAYQFEYYGSGRSNVPSGAHLAAFVRSGGPNITDDSFIRARLYTTLNAALALCQAGVENYVIVLPGHAENVSAADQMSSLIANTKIVGMGEGTLRGAFTWTAATATFLLDVANVKLSNLQLVLATSANSGVSVAAPITVTGSSCEISDCLITAPGDANDLATIGITVSTGGAYFNFLRNVCIGATAAISTAFLSIAAVVDGVLLQGNYISWATSVVTVGSVRATAAATNLRILDNFIANKLASSEEALTLANSVTGFWDRNFLVVNDNASVALDNDGDMSYGNDNYLQNNTAERGLQLGTVSA